MTLYITGATSLVEPGLDVLFVYKMRCPSRNRYLAEMPSHTHLKPTIRHAALTLTYRSLRSSRRSIHNGSKTKVRKVVRYVLRKRDPLENRAKRAKIRAVNAVERISWKDCVRK